MQPLGIISGTINLHGHPLFAALREERVDTDFGPATIFRSSKIVFIARHGKDTHSHIPPHLVNHRANLAAMNSMGIQEVIGVHSTGSLKRRLKPGTLVVPNDYLMPAPGPTVFTNQAVHITPMLSEEVRQKCLQAARECRCLAVDGGVYWQTAGPRLETKAEIAMMSRFADLVGMTMASEAIIAQELGLAFASLCSVDNYGHGLDVKGLTMEKIRWHAQRNSEKISLVLTRILEAKP
ncbi:MAG: MTAP family purine nucleoside phosphorylase [Syntrophaceae bacterium]|nr:MTAP family purine nucleoside phosphorylase [Syntrophaceae bacterium]